MLILRELVNGCSYRNTEIFVTFCKVKIISRQNFFNSIHADFRSLGSVPDHHNKGSIATKQVKQNFFHFPMHIKIMFTL